VTEDAELRLVPVIVMVVTAFGHALEGVKEEIAGPRAAYVK
jgi:hypothetical protein